MHTCPGRQMQLYYSASMLEVGKLSMGVDVNIHLCLLTKSQGVSINA